jgi:4-hydroxy-3-polyprenylbenzoate decarboxylase
VICVRETPLSTITLEQCAKLSRDGAVIMPISPPLYFNPRSVKDYTDAFTKRLLNVLNPGSSRGWRAEELE